MSAMIFLVLTVAFNLLSTGNFQKVSDTDKFKVPQENLRGPIPVLGDQWPVQTIQTVQGNFFGQAYRNINAKPCSNRRNLQDLDEQWIPTYSSRIIKPMTGIDQSKLNAQAIEEQDNNGIKYAPVVTPIIKDNVPMTVTDNEENNLYQTKSALIFDELTENRVEDPTEVQDTLTSVDRSDIGITENEDALSFVNNDEEADKIPKDVEDVKLSNQEELNSESESTEDTSDLSEECINKKKKKRLTGDSRRTMLKLGDPSEMNDKTDYELNIDNNILTIAEENKNAVNTRRASPPKLSTNEKLPSYDPKNELQDPAQGSGVTELSSRMMLMDYSRLCYACSTAGNPTCWAPDRRTTVKYCHKGHDACVIKTFLTGNKQTLVRDCGKSCEDDDVPGFVPKYKSCSICHSDLCNSAYTINSYNVIFATLLVTAIKFIG